MLFCISLIYSPEEDRTLAETNVENQDLLNPNETRYVPKTLKM